MSAPMRTYLSFGAGVNSVAMYLLLLDQGMEPGDTEKGFEAIYVDHGSDWPHTLEFVDWFAARYPLTILRPDVEGWSNLVDYYEHYKIFPYRTRRSCTDRFKVRVMEAYVQKPCFQLIGIDAGESHRAKISNRKGIELRYPLLENEIDRKGCNEIIAAHGVPDPGKSGCWICPFQKTSQWRLLRRKHPDLFCRAKKIEKASMDRRISVGKDPHSIGDKPLDVLVDERQHTLVPEADYPHCQCGL